MRQLLVTRRVQARREAQRLNLCVWGGGGVGVCTWASAVAAGGGGAGKAKCGRDRERGQGWSRRWLTLDVGSH